MRRRSFDMITPRPKTEAEERADLERRLGLVSAEANRANEENQRLRGRLDEADRRQRAAEHAAFLADCRWSDALRAKEALELENRELRTRLEGLDALKSALAKAEAELKAIRRKLNIRMGSESPFGLSTPSSRDPLKKNSSEERKARKGGGRNGHKGSWRKAAEPDAEEKGVLVPAGDGGCCCGENLELFRTHKEVIVRYIPGHFRHTLCTYGIFRCKVCGGVVTGRIRDTFPGMKHDFSTLAEIMRLAYEDFLPYGLISRQMRINKGTLFGMLHRMAERFAPLYDEIRRRIRKEAFLQADETSWRSDGHSGYTWLFTNEMFRLFLFRATRASSVAQEVLGDSDLALVSDRYAGYSPLKVRHQYCYVHLMRDLKKMLEDDPESGEVKAFAEAMPAELKASVALQGKPDLSDAEYKSAATAIRDRIMDICGMDAQDGAVRAFQDLFREKQCCLFQWVDDRRIPCHNNNAERRLRPVVIARKISMGCQGERGMRTREVLGTIVQTAVARGKDVTSFLMACMRRMSEAPGTDLYSLLC